VKLGLLYMLYQRLRKEGGIRGIACTILRITTVRGFFFGGANDEKKTGPLSLYMFSNRLVLIHNHFVQNHQSARRIKSSSLCKILESSRKESTDLKILVLSSRDEEERRDICFLVWSGLLSVFLVLNLRAAYELRGTVPGTRQKDAFLLRTQACLSKSGIIDTPGLLLFSFLLTAEHWD
jgi:hypothetical protein